MDTPRIGGAKLSAISHQLTARITHASRDYVVEPSHTFPDSLRSPARQWRSGAGLARRNRRASTRSHGLRRCAAVSLGHGPATRRSRARRARAVCAGRADPRRGAEARRPIERRRLARRDDSSARRTQAPRPSRSKTFASISRMATGTDRTRRKTHTRNPPRARLPKDSKRTRCRHSSAFGSSRCRTSCTSAVCGRSISS